MAGHRTPRSVKAAMTMLERYAELDAHVTEIEAARNEIITRANAHADAAMEPLLKEIGEITLKLEPWWTGGGAAEVTQGKRKSGELGGCIVGTVAGRDSLDIDGDEDAIVETLKKRSWAAPLLRVITKLDKKAILQSLDGAYKKQLAEMGLKRKTGGESFYIKRTEQTRTMASAKA